MKSILAFGHDDGQLRAAELEQHLAAHAAGRGDKGVVRHAHLGAHHGNGLKLAHALAYGLEQGRALGTVGGGVGGALDVAAVYTLPSLASSAAPTAKCE